MEDHYPSRNRSQPAVSQRFDPVVHTASRSSELISPAEIDRYERDGVLVIENVLSAREVAQLKAEGDALRSRAHEFDPETVIGEPGGAGEAVRSVFALHQQSEAFLDLARDERLAGIARFLLDDEVYIHQSRLNYKPPFRGKEFYWHSDFETWHVEDGMPRMRALSMSVMLTDNHSQAGPTMFVPGSQNRFIQCIGETPDENYKTSLRKQETGVPDEENLSHLVDEGGIIAPAPPAGSVVIFECNTMHGSNGNITPLERANAFFVFNAWSNRLVAPFGGTAPRPEFVAHRRPEGPLKRLAKRSQEAA